MFHQVPSPTSFSIKHVKSIYFDFIRTRIYYRNNLIAILQILLMQTLGSINPRHLSIETLSQYQVGQTLIKRVFV
jgi:hypothetical protein